MGCFRQRQDVASRRLWRLLWPDHQFDDLFGAHQHRRSGQSIVVHDFPDDYRRRSRIPARRPSRRSSIPPLRRRQAADLGVVYFDSHFQAPQIQQTDLTIQREVGWNTVVSVSYLGSFGRSLPDFVDTNINQANAGTVTYTVGTGGPIDRGDLYDHSFQRSAAKSESGRHDGHFQRHQLELQRVCGTGEPPNEPSRSVLCELHVVSRAGLRAERSDV